MIVRTTVDPIKVVPVIRKKLAAVDPDVPSYWARTLNDIIREERAPYDLTATLFTVFGISALLLSLVGLFGVMSSSINQRVREFGVRMALGGQRVDIVKMILRQGAIQIGLGIVLSLILALSTAHFLSAMIFHVSPYDSKISLGLLGTVAATGLLACLIPPCRAGNIQPNEALRVD
jgi:ABC-type antimicrobial peptide transport system permease subunit